MSILSEIRSLRALSRLPRSARRLVFYAENAGYYYYFQGLLNELERRGERAIYITSDDKDPVLKSERPCLRAFHIDRLLPYYMRTLDADVAVMTLTDLGNHYLKRSFRPVHYVYAFHSLASTHMAFTKGAFDNYDSLLCPGPQQLREIKKREELYKLKPKKLVEAGYYPLEKLNRSWKERPARTPDKKTVLIAPSWGDKNILESCGQELIRILLGARYKVVVRPHYETARRHPEVIKALKEEFGDNPDFAWSTAASNQEAFLESDTLMSDWSGAPLTYALGTERPVLFIDVPRKIKNLEYEALDIEPIEVALRHKIGLTTKPDSLGEVPALLEKLFANKDKYRDEILRLRSEYIYNFGHSAKTGAEYIMELLR